MTPPDTDMRSAAQTGTPAAPIVFLHIPKTAGQTIHSELTRVVGADAVSPVRVHTQAEPGTAQLPAGYGLYSGHLDWAALETLPDPRFSFTVLRDPLERIASFYFYLRREADKLTPEQIQQPAHTGARMITTRSVDDYFFGGPQRWQRFVHDHYNNVYCTYLVTRQIRGWKEITKIPRPVLVDQAIAAAKTIDKIYTLSTLSTLEDDIEARTGQRIAVTDRYVNAGPDARKSTRWDDLRAMFETDACAERVARFARLDQRLMRRMKLTP